MSAILLCALELQAYNNLVRWWREGDIGDDRRREGSLRFRSRPWLELLVFLPCSRVHGFHLIWPWLSYVLYELFWDLPPLLDAGPNLSWMHFLGF